MQENEELRSRLYDTHNTLAAAGGEGASEEHWRELAMSIAKSADDEKAQILEVRSPARAACCAHVHVPLTRTCHRRPVHG